MIDIGYIEGLDRASVRADMTRDCIELEVLHDDMVDIGCKQRLEQVVYSVLGPVGGRIGGSYTESLRSCIAAMRDTRIHAAAVADMEVTVKGPRVMFVKAQSQKTSSGQRRLWGMEGEAQYWKLEAVHSRNGEMSRMVATAVAV